MSNNSTDLGSSANTSVSPPRDIRVTLAAGAISALLAGLLSANGSMLEPPIGQPRGFTVSSLLFLMAVALQIVVLGAFVRLAQTIDPVGLRSLRLSSICCFLTLWLVTISAVVDGSFPAPGSAATGLALFISGLCCAVMLCNVIGRGCWPIPVGVYAGAKYLGGWLTTGKALRPLDAMVVASVILIAVSLIGYTIWFAASLIRARGKLGPPAGWLGWIILASLIGSAVMLGWVATSVVMTPGVEQLSDPELDELLTPYLRPLNVFSIVVEIAVAIFTAVLFLSIRRQLRAKSTDQPMEN